MKIGVLSDTHDHLPLAAIELLRGMDEIWHLGDICDMRVITRLSALAPVVRFVCGNCDDGRNLPESLLLDMRGQKVRLIHIPPSKPLGDENILLHGHTHVPRDELIDGVRFLNPGSAGRPNKGAPASIAHLHLTEEGSFLWEVKILS